MLKHMLHTFAMNFHYTCLSLGPDPKYKLLENIKEEKPVNERCFFFAD